MNFNYTFNVVLYNPQIPPNTGNIIRLCRNTGSRLYLIKRLGFSMNDKSLKRAGLDYGEYKNIVIYDTFNAFLKNTNFNRFYLVTKFGKLSYEKPKYQFGDCFIFGSEINGLSNEVYQSLKKSERIFIPMMKGNRSINLANAVSVCVYEAWKKNLFKTS